MIRVESTPVAGIYIRNKNGETVYFSDVIVEGKHYRSRDYATIEEALNAQERLWARALKHEKSKK